MPQVWWATRASQSTTGRGVEVPSVPYRQRKKGYHANPEPQNERTRRYFERLPVDERRRRKRVNNAKWREQHPDTGRQWNALSKYKIDFLAWWAKQNGMCALCGTPMEKTGRGSSSVSVDHNRACCNSEKSCGKCVRGLIHRRCNSLLGHASDDPKILMAAIAYLERKR